MMNAFSEGLVLADKSGLSSDTLLDILVRQSKFVSSELMLLVEIGCAVSRI